MSQTQLGDRVGVPQTTISRWEQGRVDLSVERVRAVEEALGLQIGTLLVLAGYVDIGRAEAEVSAWEEDTVLTTAGLRSMLHDIGRAVAEQVRASEFSDRSHMHPSDSSAGFGELVSVAEAAEILGIHSTTAYNLIRKGEFPVRTFRVGKNIRVPKAALLQLAASR
jgi:excisionase family DNA binding protein